MLMCNRANFPYRIKYTCSRFIVCCINNSNIRDILGTIAGDDTIFIVLREDANKDAVMFELSKVVPNMG